jgi:hypothetical protein
VRACKRLAKKWFAKKKNPYNCYDYLKHAGFQVFKTKSVYLPTGELREWQMDVVDALTLERWLMEMFDSEKRKSWNDRW